MTTLITPHCIRIQSTLYDRLFAWGAQGCIEGNWPKLDRLIAHNAPKRGSQWKPELNTEFRSSMAERIDRVYRQKHGTWIHDTAKSELLGIINTIIKPCGARLEEKRHDTMWLDFDISPFSNLEDGEGLRALIGLFEVFNGHFWSGWSGYVIATEIDLIVLLSVGKDKSIQKRVGRIVPIEGVAHDTV